MQRFPRRNDDLRRVSRARAGSILVHKYGGSSLATAEQIGRVADRIAAVHATGVHVAVVVSAMGKTTDSLVRLASEVSKAPPPRELDVLLTTGERISRALLAMALEARGVPALSLSGSECGIVTDGPHTRARIVRIEPSAVHAAFAQGRVVVVAGFQGARDDGQITTLGRGGSDTSAVALAGALGAERCEIYSDVDGVYTADPRICPDARRLARIGYDAMEELSRQGARVLHERAIVHARASHVRIHACSTFGSAAYTEIGPGDPHSGSELHGIVGVTGRKDLLHVRTHEAEVAMAVRGALGEEVPVVATRADGGDVELWASTAQVPRPDVLAAELASRFGSAITLQPLRGSVALVGTRPAELHAARTLLEETLDEAGIARDAILPRGHAVVATLAALDVDRAVKALHRAAIEVDRASEEPATWAG